MSKSFFYGRHFIDKKDIRSVTKSLESSLSQGPILEKFEKEVSRFFGSKYCVAFSSATAALHVAIASLKLKKNSNAFTSAMTFVATPNSCIYNNLKPNLIDINEDDYNIDLDLLEQKLSKLKKRDKKLILPVHFGGLPCDMNRIKKIAKKYNCYVIEDASQAMGSQFNNSYVGNSSSDAIIFSLHPVKSITSGEGGLMLTNSSKIFKKAKLLRSHGLVRYKKKHWKSNMIELGYNYKITEFQCALGLSQLKKLKNFITKRNQIAKYYKSKLKNPGIIFQKYNNNKYLHSYHYFIVKFKKKISRLKMNSLIENLKKKNIFLGRQYLPIHQHSFYSKIFKKKFVIADKYFDQSVQLPIYPSLSLKDLKYVTKTFKSAINKEKII